MNLGILPSTDSRKLHLNLTQTQQSDAAAAKLTKALGQLKHLDPWVMRIWDGFGMDGPMARVAPLHGICAQDVFLDMYPYVGTHSRGSKE